MAKSIPHFLLGQHLTPLINVPVHPDGIESNLVTIKLDYSGRRRSRILGKPEENPGYKSTYTPSPT